MNSSLNKLLLINSLNIPSEIQGILKSFIFIDKITAQTRERQNLLMQEFYEDVAYEESVDNQPWGLFYSKLEMQAVNCTRCGDFRSLGSTTTYYHMTPNAICRCNNGMFIQHHTILRLRPIHMIGWVN
jgi:hypothetical protein